MILQNILDETELNFQQLFDSSEIFKRKILNEKRKQYFGINIFYEYLKASNKIHVSKLMSWNVTF